MHKICRCGGELVSCWETKTAFCKRCSVCKRHYQQHKRLPRGYKSAYQILLESLRSSKIQAQVDRAEEAE